jgi:hypothetical protein
LPGVHINDDTNFVKMAQNAVRVGQLDQNGGYVNLTVDDAVAIFVASMTTDGFE